MLEVKLTGRYLEKFTNFAMKKLFLLSFLSLVLESE